MVLQYHPGRLNTQVDCLMCHHDVYTKEGGSNNQCQPTQLLTIVLLEQLASSLQDNYDAAPVNCAASIMDTERLYAAITAIQHINEVSKQKLSDLVTAPNPLIIDSNVQWTHIGNDPLLYSVCLYVPNIDNLCLKVLQMFHDHIMAGHFSQSKTYNLMSCKFFWPGLCKDIQAFIKSCITCSQVKAPQH